MALKLTIDNLVEVPGNLRGEYKQGQDGKFHLDIDGEHPDSVKVTQFRDKNIALLKEVEELRQLKTKYEGMDDLAKDAMDKAKNASKLEADLAAERSAHARTQFNHTVTREFLGMGGRPSAVEFMEDQAAKVFSMVDGKITT